MTRDIAPSAPERPSDPAHILAARAAALRAPSAATTAASVAGDWLAAQVDDRILLVPLAAVRDVIAAPALTPFPADDPVLLGLVAWRGRAVTCLDALGAWRGRRRAPGEPAIPFAIIVGEATTTGERTAALPIDAVDAATTDVDPATATLAVGGAALTAVDAEGRVVVDVPALIAWLHGDAALTP